MKTLAHFLCALVLVSFVCWLDIARINDSLVPAPLHMLGMLPAICLGYLEVFFHELGHTVVLISFGQLAVPTFNFRDGGGFAMPLMERSVLLQIAIYAGVVYIGWLLFQDRAWVWLGGLCALMLLHVSFALGHAHYMLVVNFMGHGGSVLVGCFCLYRAALGRAEDMKSEAERFIQMSFGLYAVLHNMVFSWSLMTDEFARAQYMQGIGGHIANDYAVIADRLGTPLEHVAAFGMGYGIVCLGVTVVLIMWSARQERPCAL